MYSGLSAYRSRVRQFTPNARKFLAFQFFLALNTGIYGVIFNLYLLKLGYHEDFMGVLLGVVYVSAGLLALPTAMVCDRIGRRRTLLLSSILMALSLALLYTITTREMLIFASVIDGVATGAMAVASSPFMAENSSREERIHLFSMNSVVMMSSSVLGSLAGGILPGWFAGIAGESMESMLPYRFTLYLSLAAMLLTIVPLLLIKEKNRPLLDRKERFGLVARVIRSPNVQRLVFVNMLIGIGAGMVVPFFNIYFYKVLQATTGQIGLIFSIGQIVMVAGLLLIPMLVGRFGKVKTIALTELLSIPFLILIGFTMNIYMAAVGYIMRMTLMNMANPAISSFNMEIVAEEERATVSSLTQTGWYLLYAMSTFISGIMMSQGSYLLPFLITCIVYFIAAVAYYVFFLRIEKTAIAQPISV
ncbi:MAG TPA: MFS transporter [Methanocella sp.]